MLIVLFVVLFFATDGLAQSGAGARPEPQAEPGNRPGPSTSAPVSDARPGDVRKLPPAKKTRANQRRGRAAQPAKPAPKVKEFKLPAAPTGVSSDILREASQAARSGQANATVVDIKVEGNKKIEVDAVIARLQTKTGAKLDSALIRQDVDALFKTGFFYDVQVSTSPGANGAVVTYRVVEKPSVVEINFEGNDEIDGDELRETSGMKAFEILNMAKIKEAVEKIQKSYEDKGYFLARINPVVEDVTAGETVKLTFKIQENEKVKVKRITFLGNRNLGDNKLKRVMMTQEGGFFSFLSESGSYKQDAFDRDMQLLNYLYFNEGYVQVKIDRPQVYVTPDKKGIYITIRIEEGDRYKVGQVDFAGDLLFERDDLMNSVEIDGSGWYVHETLLKDIRSLQAKYGDLGYAYTNVIPRVRNRDREREVDITFEIDKGNKVYFGRITMVGNSKTRDKVIRRELQIREGELYNETRRRESLANVQRLGYFDEVNFNSSTPPDNPDVMNLDIVVKERNTGTIQVGAGYSTYSKFIFQGQVNQINLFGRGQKLGISVDLSKNQSLFNFNFTEPYFLDTEWSVGFDAYQSKRTTPEFAENKKGGAIRVGHPLAPYLRGFIRYKLDKTEITLDPDEGDEDLFPVETANGYTSSVTGTIEYDKRNDRFAPTDGVYSSLSLEYAGLGGEKKYTIGRGTGRFYKKVFWEFVFRNNLAYSFIRSNEEGKDPPFNELFLLGGANSLRGYDWYSVGKRVRSEKAYQRAINDLGYDPERAEEYALRPFGGTQQLYYQAELEFPLISEAGIKGVTFFDIGTAEDDLISDQFRSDIGFGFRWFSPIGPLRFEWGFPLGRREGDPASNFQFAVGSPF